MKEWKRGAAALCAGALLLTLSACGTTMATPAGSVGMPVLPAQSAAVQSAWTPAEAGITYTVDTNTVENSASAEDGTVVATCRYDLPILRAWRSDGSEITEAETAPEAIALKTVAAFNEKFEGIPDGGDFKEMADWAKEDYQAFPEDFAQNRAPYSDDMGYTFWQTDHLVSISGACYSYSGGAHPNSVELGWNFDLDAGSFVEPVTIATDQQAFQDAVAQEIIRQADAMAADNGMAPAEFFWENYQEIAAEWPNYAVYFDASGMTVTFSAYEMACYAAGAQSFTLSDSFLSPYLNDYGRTLLSL
jgi:hypothetical protein